VTASPQPVVFSGNNPTSAASVLAGAPLAPGEIASLYGANLATSTSSAQILPLPDQLGGASLPAWTRSSCKTRRHDFVLVYCSSCSEFPPACMFAEFHAKRSLISSESDQRFQGKAITDFTGKRSRISRETDH